MLWFNWIIFYQPLKERLSNEGLELQELWWASAFHQSRNAERRPRDIQIERLWVDAWGGVPLGAYQFAHRCSEISNSFIGPNEIFVIDLSSTAIAIYCYLLCCEDRKTYTCYPSFRAIGKAVGVTKKTVEKYVRELEEKRLIETKRTHMAAKDGKILNGNLEYHILPIQEALSYYHENKIHEFAAEQKRTEQRKMFRYYYLDKAGWIN